jgi:hypothetical protein
MFIIFFEVRNVLISVTAYFVFRTLGTFTINLSLFIFLLQAKWEFNCSAR